MRKRSSWKKIFKYSAGIAALAVSLVFAWGFPEFYSSWQDEKLIGQVHLDTREQIQFLDTSTLDAVSRLKLLSKAKQFEVNGIIDNNVITYAEVQETIQQCRSQLTSWCEHGLFPEEIQENITETELIALLSYSLILDQQSMILNFFQFGMETMQEGEEASSFNDVTVVMDAETDQIYYASVKGTWGQRFAAQCLGADSWSELGEMVTAGKFFSEEEDYSGYDLAGVCGAVSQKIFGTQGAVELTAELEFETFTGQAGRSMVSDDSRYGIAWWFGTDQWPYLVALMETYRGETEYEVNTGLLFDRFVSNPWMYQDAERYGEEGAQSSMGW